MNWKLKLILWFVNNVQPIREVDVKYIDKERLLKLAEPMKKNGYGQYLIRLANEHSTD